MYSVQLISAAIPDPFPDAAMWGLGVWIQMTGTEELCFLSELLIYIVLQSVYMYIQETLYVSDCEFFILFLVKNWHVIGINTVWSIVSIYYFTYKQHRICTEDQCHLDQCISSLLR